MKVLHADTTVLKANTMDELFALGIEYSDGHKGRRRGSITISLEDVEFVDPYGLVSLWVLARYLGKKFRTVKLVMPRSQVLRSYLQRMNFQIIMDQIAETDEHDSFVRRTPPSDVLLEMTPIHGHADVVKVTGMILGRIGRILKTELQYDRKDIAQFSSLVSEVCMNIFDHSEDSGMVAAQRYTNSEGKKYVIVAVADLGIGIRRSLSERYPEAMKWTDIEAMINALKKDFSRHPNRGLGLFMVSKLVNDYGGSLDMRTGSARLHIRQRGTGFSTADFPGTQISISLSARS